MEESVSGIRGTFYHSLIDDYQEKQERSFLYRYFWAESIKGLFEKHFPKIKIKRAFRPEDEPRIRHRLSEAMRERQEWAKSLLLKEVPGKARKERRDFWEELWLNDIGCQAGVISDTEYCLWLVEYLAARGVYYKDNSMPDGHAWLYELLLAGLALEPGQLWGEDGKSARTGAQVGRDLAELARLIRDERNAGTEEIVGRLSGLKRRESPGEDYLPWLTGQLEKMALRIRIKTWLQDSGYPLRDESKAKGPPKGSRKQDFSMRLFEAYCDREEGFDLVRKSLGGKAAGGWRLDGEGFCVLVQSNQVEALLEALKRGENTYFYLPLAVDLFSGCVFFLAGKEIYAEVYRNEEKKLREDYEHAQTDYKREKTRSAEVLYEDAKSAYGQAKRERAAYDSVEALYCFDYLRVDEDYLLKYPEDIGGALRLRPFFHYNKGRPYQDVLSDFKAYCVTEKGGPRDIVREFNDEGPDGIPPVFHWAFKELEDQEKPQVSPEAQKAFLQARKRAR